MSDDRSSSSLDGNDETWDDWVEDPAPCRSLFEQLELSSASEAVKHDREIHGFDINEVSRKMGLDFHQRIRLINYTRKKKPAPRQMLQLTGAEAFLNDNEFLQPAIEDDPLLMMDTGEWDDEDSGHKEQAPFLENQKKTGQSATVEIDDLRSQLEAVTTQLSQLRTRAQALVEGGYSSPDSDKPARDDDSHYFESYGYQEIHATMIRDSIRTSSYAKFILSNPQVFRDKLVMDVGCGTGILSMFAARAGAKHVFAVDASAVALKARQNITDSGLQNVITVIQGKVESIKLPAPYDGPEAKVDIIVSEWMGYALLYESMLDSVLVARDRFLRPPSVEGMLGGGVMAPSQCKMVMSLAETTEIWKDKVTFWNDVYGFKMTSMAEEAFGDALIEHIPSNAVASDLVTIKDISTQRVTIRDLEFSSPFKFTVSRDTTIHAFLLYFDTYFTPDGSDVPQDAVCTIAEPEGNFVTAEIVQVGAGAGRNNSTKGKEGTALKEKENEPTTVSFSTGPQSLCTHWKQTVFLLRQPFIAIEGTVVSGTFHLRKSEENTCELDVEIHFSVSHTGFHLKTNTSLDAAGTTVHMYKVR